MGEGQDVERQCRAGDEVVTERKAESRKCAANPPAIVHWHAN
jgi:hypothetical protein